MGLPTDVSQPAGLLLDEVFVSASFKLCLRQ